MILLGQGWERPEACSFLGDKFDWPGCSGWPPQYSPGGPTAPSRCVRRLAAVPAGPR